MLKVVFYRRLSCIKGAFHQKLSSIKGCPPSKVVLHQRLSWIKGCLLSKFASIKGQLPSKVFCCSPSKVVFHQRSFPIKGSSPSKGVFHQRSFSIKGRSPSKFVFHQRSSSVLLYQICSKMFWNVSILPTTLKTSLYADYHWQAGEQAGRTKHLKGHKLALCPETKKKGISLVHIFVMFALLMLVRQLP